MVEDPDTAYDDWQLRQEAKWEDQLTYYKTGLAVGEANRSSKLTNQDVVDIFLSPEKAEYLAAKYSVSKWTIYNIWKRKTWQHLTKHLQVYQRRRINSTKDVTPNLPPTAKR
jgi:hypothetical protein